MRIFTNEEKLKAIELFIQYDFSPGAVITQIGYPSHRSVLYRWYKAYKANGDCFPEKLKRGRSKYTGEQKRIAVDYYLTHGKSLKKTINALGYPGTTCLCEWLNELAPGQNRKWFCKRNDHMVRCSQDQKCPAVLEYTSGEKTVSQIAEELNISKETVYSWKNKLLGRKKKMAKDKKSSSNKNNTIVHLDKDSNLKEEVRILKEQAELLKKEIYNLQLEKDVLTKATEIIKKDQGIDLKQLSNREKAILINALRDCYPLKELLAVLNMAKSIYCYQRTRLEYDKYKDLRKQIRIIFKESNNSYGYRRLHSAVAKSYKRVSEKVIRRIMAEENLFVNTPKTRKYNSYKGEISPEVENVINRDFHADKPNEKWLTDITEFNIPAGKVYLSPIIDCFDGMPITWTIGTSPCAELVNTMLDDGIAQLKPGEYPIVHTDRGCHYRWPGWIQRMDEAGLIRSMSKKGCSPDNAACEGFFGRLKNEMFYGVSWIGVSIKEFVLQLDKYLHWYAEKRIKLSLGGLSPVQYRTQLGLI